MSHRTQQPEDFTSAINNRHSGSDDEFGTEYESSEHESDELKQVRAAAAPRAANASPDEVRTVSMFVSVHKLLILIL